MADSLIENVSDTAFWVAHYRAVETRRPDALFHDPLAAVLAGEQGEQIAKDMPLRFMTAWVIAIRTRLIDEYIQGAISEGIDAVVNLGAGLDARPYRMDLPPSLLWIEADYPKMIEFKQSRLAGETPKCNLERVAMDLANLSARREFFKSIDARARKILILTEGVVPYLSVEEAGSLADDLKTITHLRYWIADYLSPMVMKFRQRGGIAKKTKNAPFKFRPPDWFVFFQDHGWRAKEIRYLAEEADKLNRKAEFPMATRALIQLRLFFASPKRREAFKRAAGYALLEPISISDQPQQLQAST
jgi:methyltransferase (TIGR00027 family)